MAIVSQLRVGPIRAVTEAYGASLALFTQAEANRIVRTGLIAGGQFWINNFMMKRFSGYAWALLGYRASGRWVRKKQKYLGKQIPFVGFSPGKVPGWKKPAAGQTKTFDAVQRTARATAVASDTDGEIRIKLNFGHPVQPVTAEAFKRIPSHEVGAIAGEVKRVIGGIIAGAPGAEQLGKLTIRGAISTLPARNPGSLGQRKIA